MNSAAVRRIMREIKEMQKESSTLYCAEPLEDNIFEWHFTLRGPRDTPYEGGVYHGRIILPPEYPLEPPDIVFLTPNGRFKCGQKICLTISSHHKETWRPSWSVRTVILALMSFMPTPGDGAIGALNWSEANRKEAARKSLSWKCTACGSANLIALPPEDPNEASKVLESDELKDITKEMRVTTKEQLVKEKKIKKGDDGDKEEEDNKEEKTNSADSDNKKEGEKTQTATNTPITPQTTPQRPVLRTSTGSLLRSADLDPNVETPIIPRASRRARDSEPVPQPSFDAPLNASQTVALEPGQVIAPPTTGATTSKRQSTACIDTFIGIVVLLLTLAVLYKMGKLEFLDDYFDMYFK